MPGKCRGRQDYPSGANFLNAVRSSKCPRSRAGEMPRSPNVSFRSGFSERMGKQSRIIEVPEISCQRSVDAVKSIPQERGPERRCEQSDKVTETSSQDLDETVHESTSRFCERIREKRRKGEKEKNPSSYVAVSGRKR